MPFVAPFIIYLFFRAMVGAIRLLPFNTLPYASAALAFILQKGFRYRVNTVRKNLKSCPSLQSYDLKIIEKDFYNQLASHLFEAIKGFSADPNQLDERYSIANPEILLPFFENKKSILLVGSHFLNWEWGIQVFNRQIPHQVCGIYQRIQNPYIHAYLMRKRGRTGMHLIGYDGAIQTISHLIEPSAVMILADQSPSNVDKAIWTSFLGRQTPFVHGLEALAHKCGYPMFYCDVIKIRPGFYKVHLSPLSLTPNQENPGDITRRYAAKLETTILENPAGWLWSHKRWKRVPAYMN